MRRQRRREGSLVVLLLAQRAVADSPRWTRAGGDRLACPLEYGRMALDTLAGKDSRLRFLFLGLVRQVRGRFVGSHVYSDRHSAEAPGRGGSGWLDSFTHSLSGASRVVDYAAVRRVVRFS